MPFPTLSPADHEIAERANASLAGMAGFAPYKAPCLSDAEIMGVAPAIPHVSPKLARENKARLDAFVSAALTTAPTVEDPADYLQRSADKLNGFILALDCGATPRHLVGVSAWDLSEARDRLSAEAGRLATIAKAEAALAAAELGVAA